MPKKGISNNPKGRPKKGYTLSDIIRDFMSKQDPAKKKVRREVLVETVYTQAVMGDQPSQKLLFNYDAGMPVQMSITADADDETTKQMREHAKNIFGSKRDTKK